MHTGTILGILANSRYKNVTIVRAASEYATDLQKCILAVEEYEEENNLGEDRQLVVVILGGLSGRVDQTMHTFHVLCQLAKTGSPTVKPPSVRRGKKNYGLNSSDYVQLERRNKTIAISENSVAWLLTKVSRTPAHGIHGCLSQSSLRASTLSV